MKTLLILFSLNLLSLNSPLAALPKTQEIPASIDLSLCQFVISKAPVAKLPLSPEILSTMQNLRVAEISDLTNLSAFMFEISSGLSKAQVVQISLVLNKLGLSFNPSVEALSLKQIQNEITAGRHSDITIAQLGFPPALVARLLEGGKHTLADLQQTSLDKLAAESSVGPKTAWVIFHYLTNINAPLTKTAPNEIWIQTDTEASDLDQLHLSARARNVLNHARIRNLSELAARSKSDLLELQNCGATTASEIEGRLATVGLRLSDTGIQSTLDLPLAVVFKDARFLPKLLELRIRTIENLIYARRDAFEKFSGEELVQIENKLAEYKLRLR